MIKTLKYLNLIFFILMIVINTLANILPLGHGNTGDISSKYQNLFTPAPITFSIWGIIYLLLCIFIVYQLDLLDNQMFTKTILVLIGPWFIISCIMNIGWIFSWHYDVIWLSLLFMLGLLFSLIMISAKFSPTIVEQTSGVSETTFLAKLCFYTFDIYLGWIAVATIANVIVLLIKLSWNGFGVTDQIWTILIIFVGALLGILFVLFGHRYMSAVAIIWAYCGILIKHISMSGFAGKYPSIIITTIIGIVAIVSTIVVNMIMKTNPIS